MVVNSNSLESQKISKASFLILFGLSIILGWKLFRLLYPQYFLWNIHNYTIVLLSMFSVAISYRRNLYLEKTKTAVLVFLFLIISVIRLGYFPSLDPFFISSFVFCLYFIMVSFFMKISDELWFKYF